MGWSPFRKTGLTYSDSRSHEGYTLITPIGGESVFLLDHEGRIAHRWSFEGFHPGYGYLLPGGRLLVRGTPVIDEPVNPGEPAGAMDILLELDWNSKELWRWESEVFHHDMCRLPNGNTLVIVWESLPEYMHEMISGGLSEKMVEYVDTHNSFLSFILQGMGVGGRPRLKPPLTDALCEIDKEGNVVNIWHAYDHLDPEKDVICPLCFPGEWSHANAIELTDDGDVLISFRELSKVMKISWPQGDVLWQWGKPEISHQHDATPIGDNRVLIFDNGTHHPIQGKSRIVEVNTDKNEIVWQYVGSPVFSFNCGHIGGCERLPNGNTLICEGESGRVFEVTPECDICWEWNSPFINAFKGTQTVMLFRAHRYEANGEELKGQLMDSVKMKVFNQAHGLF